MTDRRSGRLLNILVAGAVGYAVYGLLDYTI
jgi:hypothetical protein